METCTISSITASDDYDLFLSYRRSDAARIEPLLKGLGDLGLRIWRDTREIEDFASVQSAINDGLAQSRAMLVWYSTDYPKSRACQWELTAAYIAAQAEGDPRRRILVMNPEATNGHIHLPELFDQQYLTAPAADDVEAIKAAALSIKNSLEDLQRTFRDIRALTSPRWLPHQAVGSNRFVGRLAEMWRIHGHLQAGESAMLTGSGGKPDLVQVQGAGGIGKSLLAEEYALRFGAAYPGGVFWLRAFGHPDGGSELSSEQRATFRDSQIREFAERLNLAIQGLSPAQVTGQLHAHFKQENQPFLWVVDDYPTESGPQSVGPWLAPHPLGRTLISTRARTLQHIACIELPQLDKDEAYELLTRADQSDASAPKNEQEETAALEICSILGYHALAVDVAAALTQRRGYESTFQALQNPDEDALDLAAQLTGELPNGHEASIAATFLASMNLLDEGAMDLLRLATVLVAAPIPRGLAVGVLARINEHAATEAGNATDLGLSQLIRNSLVDATEGGGFVVHTLVTRTLRFHDKKPETRSGFRTAAVETLAETLPRVADIREHAELADWVTQARELGRAPEDAAAVDLLGWVARHDFERGDDAGSPAAGTGARASKHAHVDEQPGQHALGARRPRRCPATSRDRAGSPAAGAGARASGHAQVNEQPGSHALGARRSRRCPAT